MLYTYCKANMQRGPWPCKNAPCLWLYREACRYLEKYRSSRHPASQTSLVTATSLISLNEPLLQIVNWTSLPNSATTVISQQSAQTHALLSTTLPYREACGRVEEPEEGRPKEGHETIMTKKPSSLGRGISTFLRPFYFEHLPSILGAQIGHLTRRGLIGHLTRRGLIGHQRGQLR